MTVGSRTKTLSSRFSTSTPRATMTYSALTGRARLSAVVGKTSPVGVATGVKKGKGVLLLHSGTQVGQSERVRRGVGTSSAATTVASTATAKPVKILANILAGWLDADKDGCYDAVAIVR